MCRPDDFPPYDQPHQPVRLYDVEYHVRAPGRSPFRKARVWASTTDEARLRVSEQDPDYIATTRSPRIVR